MLTLYKPKPEDLWFRQMMLGDEDTMSYNHAWGGTIPWPESKWSSWYDAWVVQHEGKRYYRYLKDEGGQFVGEIAYHYDEDRNIHICDVIVLAKYRGRGYGSAGINLLCQAAKENGIAVLYDDIAADNPSWKLFLKNGFEIDWQNDEVVMVKKTL